MDINPTLLRLSLGIPTAAAGGLFGYLTGNKEHKLESAARGAGIGYLAGGSAGLGAELGYKATDEPNRNLGMIAGGLTGGMLGAGVGTMMQGVPAWEQRRKFREELVNLLQTEQDKLRKEIHGQDPIKALQKISQEKPKLVELAEEDPELTLIPLAGMAGGALANSSKSPNKNVGRGVLHGLLTGTGAAGGAILGHKVNQDAGGPVGGVLGGLLTYLATKRLLHGQEKRALSPALAQLIEAKQLSDQKQYKNKHQRLRQLVEQYPDDFIIDSQKGDIVGLTHLKSGFKIHVPANVIPVPLKRVSNESVLA